MLRSAFRTTEVVVAEHFFQVRDCFIQRHRIIVVHSGKPKYCSPVHLYITPQLKHSVVTTV